MPGGTLLLSDVFDNDGTSGVTLKQSLGFSGGPTLQDAKNVLLRQAAAAYANSIRLAPNYPLTTAQVVSQTNRHSPLAIAIRSWPLRLSSTALTTSKVRAADSAELHRFVRKTAPVEVDRGRFSLSRWGARKPQHLH